jgi:hypothetical protein
MDCNEMSARALFKMKRVGSKTFELFLRLYQIVGGNLSSVTTLVMVIRIHRLLILGLKLCEGPRAALKEIEASIDCLALGVRAL